MDDAGPLMRIERLLKDRGVGEFEAGGVFGRVIEPAQELPLADPVAIYPADLEFDRVYQAGPTFVFHLTDGYVDPPNGFAFTSERNFVRESAVVGKYSDRAAELYAKYDFDAAQSVRAGEVVVVSNQRSKNYCRWWLDTVSKIFLFEAYAPTRLQGRRLATWLTPPMDTPFQAATLDLIGYPPGPSFPRYRLVRGDLLLSGGLTYSGGQNISPLVRGFRDFVLNRAALPRQRGPGRRLFITRRETAMRRIVNEPELYAGLAERGFEVLVLEQMALRDQVAAFAAAEVVVAPHGAGLTNIMFSPSSALLVEIFPDSGVHSSAFRRIASNLGIRYAMYAGEASGAAIKNNLRNIDLTVEPQHLFGFIDEVMGVGP